MFLVIVLTKGSDKLEMSEEWLSLVFCENYPIFFSTDNCSPKCFQYNEKALKSARNSVLVIFAEPKTKHAIYNINFEMRSKLRVKLGVFTHLFPFTVLASVNKWPFWFITNCPFCTELVLSSFWYLSETETEVIPELSALGPSLLSSHQFMSFVENYL